MVNTEKHEAQVKSTLIEFNIIKRGSFKKHHFESTVFKIDIVYHCVFHITPVEYTIMKGAICDADGTHFCVCEITTSNHTICDKCIIHRTEFTFSYFHLGKGIINKTYFSKIYGVHKF
jgi:hypothetical protein